MPIETIDHPSPRKRSKTHPVDIETISGFTSYDVFMHFVNYHQAHGKRYCDASRIVGRECYLAWLRTRRKPSVFPADVFRRTVTAHLTGTKKRRPFPKEVEASLLQTVRVRQVWPCFDNVRDNKGNPVTFGHTGFRPRGYHENLELLAKTQPKSTSFKHATFTVPTFPQEDQLMEAALSDFEIDYADHTMFDEPSAGLEMPNPEFERAPVHIPRDEMHMMRFFFDLPRVAF